MDSQFHVFNESHTPTETRSGNSANFTSRLEAFTAANQHRDQIREASKTMQADGSLPDLHIGQARDDRHDTYRNHQSDSADRSLNNGYYERAYRSDDGEARKYGQSAYDYNYRYRDEYLYRQPYQQPHSQQPNRPFYLSEANAAISKESDSSCKDYNLFDLKVDVIRDQETLKLADAALQNRDLDAFKRAMSSPSLSPEVRDYYLKDRGEKEIDDAFGSMFGGTTQEQTEALEYAKTGKLQAYTAIEKQTGTFSTDKGEIENILQSMTAEERRAYKDGSVLQVLGPNLLNGKAKDDVDYYNKVHDALSAAAGSGLFTSEEASDSQMRDWESLIAAPATQKVDICELQKTTQKAQMLRDVQDYLAGERESEGQ